MIGLYAQVSAQAAARRQAYVDALAQVAAARERAMRDLRAAEETLTKLQSTTVIVQQGAEAHKRLAAEGFYSPLAYNDKQRESNLGQPFPYVLGVKEGPGGPWRAVVVTRFRTLTSRIAFTRSRGRSYFDGFMDSWGDFKSARRFDPTLGRWLAV